MKKPQRLERVNSEMFHTLTSNELMSIAASDHFTRIGSTNIGGSIDNDYNVDADPPLQT